MARVILIFILLSAFSVRAQELTERVRELFQRSGYVVKVEPGRVIVDLGRERVRKGEEFDILREGKEIIHPVTKQSLGKERERVGRIRIEDPQEGFSYAKVLEGSPREGDRVNLRVESVCFEGSDELMFRLKSALPELARGKECAYSIKELKDGLGVEFRGSPLAFFPQQQPQQTASQVSPENVNLLARSRLLKPLPALPLSADLCDLTGSGREFLLVLYQGRLEAYEVLKNDLVRRFDYSLPAGVYVGLQCGKVSEGNQDLVLVNAIAGDSANSLILRAVGESLTPVARNLPYLMSILDKNRPKETFVGQRFTFRDKFGPAIRLSLDGNRLREVSSFTSPPGFRLDSAFYFGDYLLFTDGAGRTRIYRGSGEVFSTEEGFGGSYTLIEIPVAQGQINYIFNPRGVQIQFLNMNMALVVKNHTGVVQRFLDVVKYNRGELFIITERRKDLLSLSPLRGSNLEESIQTVLSTKDGRILVITGKTGTMGLQNRGEVYELELRVL